MRFQKVLRRQRRRRQKIISSLLNFKGATHLESPFFCPFSLALPPVSANYRLVNHPLLRPFLPTLGLALILTTSASAEINQTAATTCVQQWAMLVAQSQTDELAKILNESYQHIHGTGLVETKTTFLDALRNGTRKYEPIQLENINVRSFDRCAIVTAQFNLKATARGKKIEGVYLASFTLIQTPQGFSIVSFQATPLKTSS